MPSIHRDHWSTEEIGYREKIRRNEQRHPAERAARRPQRRPNGSESFKCGHCRTFVGPTVSGGRHRNHCPLCLYSRHVDRSHPGDRASDCRSLMAPVGTFHRADGEQMVVHRCGGCGIERQNRVAADDNALALLRLFPVSPPCGKSHRREEGEEAMVS